MNDLAMHLLDIVQNSISAGATLIIIVVEIDEKGDLLTISIEDNGKGMTQEQVKKLSDPFFTSRTTRKVGLGIPLFKQSAEQSGGHLEVRSEVGKGTTVTATFGYTNIDRPPLGDMGNAVVLLVSSNPKIEFQFKYRYNGEEYLFDTVEIKEVLEGMPINNPSVVKYLNEMVKENMKSLQNS